MKVLVVDDTAMNRKLLRTILATEGHTVLDAEDGLAALEILEREKIDAVISDILMPRMDGYRLCCEIRKNQKLNAIPFIAQTATYTSSADEQVALNFGVDKFIRKPTSPDGILNALHEVTKATNGRRAKQLQAPQEPLAMREYSEALVRKLERNNLELAEANKALEERAHLAEFNAEIANALTHKRTLRENLQLCTEAMVHHLEAAFARIWTVNQKENILELQASAGLYTRIDGGHARVPVGQYKIGLIASERKPHLTNSVIGDARVHEQEWAKREGMVAFAGYPLIVEDQLVGVMAMFASKSLSENSLKAMESVAKSIAVGIKGKWADEEREKNLDRIRALHEIEKAVTSTLDLRAVLDLLLDKIDIFLPVRAATTIRLFNQGTGQFENTTCRGIDEREWKAGGERKTGQLSKKVFETKDPLIVDNIQTDTQMKAPEFFRKRGFVSYLGVPLIAKNNVIAILGFYTKKVHEFTQQEIDFLIALAGQAAVAIHNAQLFEEIGLSNAELEKTTRYLGQLLKRLGGLYTALTPISPVSSTVEMMDGITERIMDATGADACLIRVWDKNASSYPIVGQRGFPDDYLRQVVSSSRGGAVDWVIRNGEPIITGDIALEPRLKGKAQLELGLCSCALLPLKVHDEVRGVIHVSSRRLGYFDDSQKDHLLAIARQMGITLENREYLYDLRSSRDELERANKVKDEFLGVVSHELRTPINLIMGYTNLLQERAVEPEDGLKKISGATGDLLAMVDSILHATLLEANELTVDSQEFSLESLLAEVRANYESSTPGELSFMWEYAFDLPAIKTDRGKLKQILNNLIKNALKFTDQGQVIISARIFDKGGDGLDIGAEVSAPKRWWSTNLKAERWVEFKVADTGTGIASQSLPKIFDKFYQVDSSQSRHYGGTGLGLYIVKKFTDLLGGKVEVESEVGRGSTFTVTLPADH